MTLNHLPALEGSFEGYKVPLDFLSSDAPPVRRLTDPYFEPWESLMDDLPGLVASGVIRTIVQRLPLLDASRLGDAGHVKCLRQWRRAYVVLSFISQGFIWGSPFQPSLSVR